MCLVIRLAFSLIPLARGAETFDLDVFCGYNWPEKKEGPSFSPVIDKPFFFLLSTLESILISPLDSFSLACNSNLSTSVTMC